MSGLPPLARLAGAEVLKLRTRVSVRLSLALLAAVGLMIPLGMFGLSTLFEVPPEAQLEGVQPIRFEASGALDSVLLLRNFFLVRALIIAVVAVSFAGELVARTLREDLVRPVSRQLVLAGKWCALQAFVLACAVVPFAVAVPLSLALFGASGDFAPFAARLGLTWLGDVGFATLVMAISLLVRSVPGTIGGVFLYWVFDKALGIALWMVAGSRDFLVALFQRRQLHELERVIDAIVAVRPWLPSAAFDVWWDYDPATALTLWKQLSALALYTAVSYAVAWWWFRRIDVD